MTKISILPAAADGELGGYRGVAGDRQSLGRTPGEALDALTGQLTDDETSTLVVVQSMRADRFFGAAQQERLAELMARRRAARDSGACLPAAEQAELDRLAEAELRAATERARMILRQVPP